MRTAAPRRLESIKIDSCHRCLISRTAPLDDVDCVPLSKTPTNRASSERRSQLPLLSKRNYRVHATQEVYLDRERRSAILSMNRPPSHDFEAWSILVRCGQSRLRSFRPIAVREGDPSTNQSPDERIDRKIKAVTPVTGTYHLRDLIFCL